VKTAPGMAANAVLAEAAAMRVSVVGSAGTLRIRTAGTGMIRWPTTTWPAHPLDSTDPATFSLTAQGRAVDINVTGDEDTA